MEDKERKFLTVPVTAEEYKKMTALIVQVTKDTNEPTTKAAIMRDALNMMAVQVQGVPIFE